MKDNTTLTWFLGVIDGRWSAAPADVAVPASARTMSEHWAGVLLNAASNPYRRGTPPLQRLFFGLDRSPDKLSTAMEDDATHIPFTVTETLQHFVLHRPLGPDRPPVRDVDAMLAVLASSYAPLLSADARRVVATIAARHAEADAGTGAEKIDANTTIVVSSSDVEPGAVQTWSDRVNAIWHHGTLYLDFYKTYPGAATATFVPGPDWFPAELRRQLGVAPRNAG